LAGHILDFKVCKFYFIEKLSNLKKYEIAPTGAMLRNFIVSYNQQNGAFNEFEVNYFIREGNKS